MEPVETFTRNAILSALDEKPFLTWADAKKMPAVKAAAKFLSAPRMTDVLKGLMAQGVVYEWPKQGKIKSVRYSLHPADAREYLDPALDKFRKELMTLAGKLRHAGVRFEDLMHASRAALSAADSTRAGVESPPVEELAPMLPAPPPTPPEDLAVLMLDLMEELEPAARNGAAVPIAGLRHAMEFQNLDKSAFDNEILRMAEREILDLHRYDYPMGLSQAERDDLVSDDRGGYYIAVARRV